MTRKINNRLVLCNSLYEKGLVLLEKGEYEQIEVLLEEVKPLSQSLGNQDLIFNVCQLEIQLLIRQGKKEKALTLIEKLLKKHFAGSERAAILFLQQQVTLNPAVRDEALALFENLYAATPKFLYQQRINALKAAKTS